jgi:hypothetical protein
MRPPAGAQERPVVCLLGLAKDAESGAWHSVYHRGRGVSEGWGCPASVRQIIPRPRRRAHA